MTIEPGASNALHLMPPDGVPKAALTIVFVALMAFAADAATGGHTRSGAHAYARTRAAHSIGRSHRAVMWAPHARARVAAAYRRVGHHQARAGARQGRRATGVRRSAGGRIQRSSAARTAFRHSTPCPATGRTTGRCPGYVIDHVHALKHGGSDTPTNMQWQTKTAAAAKDRVE